MRSHQLVRIEFGRVRRQEEQFDLAIKFLEFALDNFRAMRRMAIDDQEHFSAVGIGGEPVDEVGEHGRIDGALDQAEAHLAGRRDRRDHVDAEARPRGLDDRGLAGQRPRRAGMVVRAHPGLVGKVDPRALRLGAALDLGVDLLLPLIHSLRVLLPGPAQGPLRAQPELAHRPADRDIGHAHAAFAAQQVAHDPSRPQREREPELARIAAADRARQPAQIIGGELRRPSRLRLRPQSFKAAVMIAFKPPIDRAPLMP